MNDKVYRAVAPVIAEVYGNSEMAKALSEYLTDQIYKAETKPTDALNQDILRICWDWMTGGGAATAAADKIIKSLQAERIIL